MTTNYLQLRGGAEYDQPARKLGDLAPHTYVVATTPRSGSNMLSDALMSSGGLSVAMEYLDLEVVVPVLSARWGASDLAEYIAMLHARRTSPEGWLGVKVHGHQLHTFVRELGGAGAAQSPWETRQVIELLFPNTRWIRLRRLDREAQAVSEWRRQRTRIAVATDEGQVDESELDVPTPALMAQLSKVHHMLASWEGVWDVMLSDVDVLDVTFEDLVEDPAREVQRCRDFLGLGPGEPVAHETRKGSGGRSAQVAEQLRQHLAGQPRGVAAEPREPGVQAHAGHQTDAEGPMGLQAAISTLGLMGAVDQVCRHDDPSDARDLVKSVEAGTVSSRALVRAVEALGVNASPHWLEEIVPAAVRVDPKSVVALLETRRTAGLGGLDVISRVLLEASNSTPFVPAALDMLVTGTGRCGTGWTASALAGSGLPFGHEELVTVDRRRIRPGLRGDVSWLAVPFLDEISGPIVHQVREPVAVIRSLVGIQMFSSPVHGPYRWWMFATQPGLTGDDLSDAVVWYLDWNARIEARASARVRIEDLRGPEGFRGLLDALGHSEAWTGTVPEVPRETNTRKRASDDALDALTAHPRWDELVEVGERYGYEVKPPR